MLEAKTGRKMAIPSEIVESKTKYTLDPPKIYQWRNRMADQLERIIKEESKLGER
jgi:hypothetical protein